MMMVNQHINMQKKEGILLENGKCMEYLIFGNSILIQKEKGRHDMARLTGEDADGHIISTEEEWLLATKGFINKDEMYKIMMHLTEKLYEYEIADLNMCEWKRNSVFPETINNPHVSERENIATTKFCPYCGKKIKIVN